MLQHNPTPEPEGGSGGERCERMGLTLCYEILTSRPGGGCVMGGGGGN